MLTSDALAHFGNRAAIARFLNISRPAVSKWRDVVPEGSAYKLEALTDGALKVRPDLYEKSQRQSA